MCYYVVMPNWGKRDLAGVRTVHVDGAQWFCVTDFVAVLGGDPNAADTFEVSRRTPAEDLRVHDLYGINGSIERLPVATKEGLAFFILHSKQLVFVEMRKEALMGFFASMLTSSDKPARSSTRWGEQPIREILRETSVPLSRFTASLNAQRSLAAPLSHASVSSILLGRQLPSPEFLVAAQRACQRPVRELFTPRVLEASAKRYGSAPVSMIVPAQPTTPSRPSSPPVFIDPSSFVPFEDDDDFAERMAEPTEPQPERHPDQVQVPSREELHRLAMEAEQAKIDAAFAQFEAEGGNPPLDMDAD